MAVPSHSSLPGVYPELQDENLRILATTNAPRVLVVGTAEKGEADSLYVVGRDEEAASAFGSGGTLTRGMYEVKAAGAENVVLYRAGASAAKLEHIGDAAGTAGITLETAKKDDSAGTDYSMFWDGVNRLVVWNDLTGNIVYDATFTTTTITVAVDYGEVIISGTFVDTGSGAVGNSSVGVDLALVPNTLAEITYTAGTDGASPSRMALYEYYYKAYKNLEDYQFNIVVPMDMYLDDKNINRGDTLTLPGANTYPVRGSTFDVLGDVFVEEYEGEYRFFWRDTVSAVQAVLWPAGVGSASATVKCDGTSLTAADFHEVNFAYQLANFCHVISTNYQMCIGMVGVKPPDSLSLKDISTWVGTLPSYTTDASGNQTIDAQGDDGTGLLGNKFMAGKYGFRSNVAGGGFIATESGWLDGTEEEDRLGNVIDIGKYLSVVGGWATLTNAFDTSGLGYTAAYSASYSGLVSNLDSKSAPTNKVVSGASLPFRISPTKLDDLASVKYVMLQQKPKGLVVSDAPTAARAESDYTRLTTVRIVNDCVKVVRNVGDVFVGESLNALARGSVKTQIESGLSKMQKSGHLTRFDTNVTATRTQEIAGNCVIELNLVPAFELRRITLILSLRPE